MEHRPDAVAMFVHQREQILRRDEARDLPTRDVAPFRAVAQAVANDDLMLAARVQRGDEIGADEARAAGDDDQALASRVGGIRLSISRV